MRIHDLVQQSAVHARIGGLSGDLASRYRRFAAGAGPLLYGLAGTDEALGLRFITQMYKPAAEFIRKVSS